jgi:hypothetical protein
VSYRQSRPFIPSAAPQREEGLRPTPLEGAPRIPSRIIRQSVWNFCAEELPSSIPATHGPGLENQPELDRADSPPLGFINTPSIAGSQSSLTSGELGSAVGRQSTSQTASANTESWSSVLAHSIDPSLPSLYRSTATSTTEESSSPLAAFDFGFDKEDPLVSSEPVVFDSEIHIAEGQHPNFEDFRFSFPSLENVPGQISEEDLSEEPSLPTLPSEKTPQRPRGLSAAVAQDKGRAEPEALSTPTTVTSARRRRNITTDTSSPSLELPPFPRLSLGLGDSDTEISELSEVAKGKQPERRTPALEIGEIPEDMDFLHPESAMAMTEHRREAVRMAKSQEAAVIEKCKRSGVAPPEYAFDELIGKGSFGRVYKG